MANQANIGQAFPLEHLASDIARNNYNYQSILNGLVAWNNTDQDNVVIRLTTDVDPFFHDYVIPSKKSICNVNNSEGTIFGESIGIEQFSESSRINSVLYGGGFINIPPWTPDPDDLGDMITFRITVLDNGGTFWRIYYIPHIETWVSGRDYRYGNLVRDPLDGNNIYVLVNNVINSTFNPQLDPNFQLAPPGSDQPQVVSSIGTFNESTICKLRLTVDVDGFILKNEGLAVSSPNTNIKMKISAKHQELPSIYQKTVDVIPTSNFSNWPDNLSPIWSSNNIIFPTNVFTPISRRQDYSAIMVMDHTDQARCKTVNFVNYDGPDLDQGLCVYLPVEINTELGTAKPEDGFTYEFYFRIWPTASLTDATTRDHIVNKAQIYVYTSPTRDSVTFDYLEENEPIAKFSMARMTNFYMFGENVSIPDKPVIYRATFIFSESQNKWITLDYMQLPDHLFIGPVGFVDPQNPGNVDVNNDVIGEINPNASFIGYETAAFPTFVDVFSNPNLTPFRLDDGNIDGFKNRIVS